MIRYLLTFATTLVILVLVVGCTGNPQTPPATPPPEPVEETQDDEVAAERAKLSPADRGIVDAQEWCVISNEQQLGAMGPPVKLDIKGQAVFICCKGCRKKAEANPDLTLAKVEELKVKAKALREAKQ